MSPIDQFLAEGLHLQRSGQVAEAAERYRTALSLQPQHARALHLLGLAEYELGRIEQAERKIRQSISLDAQVPEFYLNLGVILQNSGRFHEAVNAYHAALNLSPQSWLSLLNLGCCLSELNHLEAASRALRQALSIAPQNAEIHRQLGRVLLKSDQGLAEAIVAFTHAAQIQPCASVFNDLGYAQKKCGRLQDAAHSFEQALKLEPKHTGALNNLSTVLKTMGKLSEAVAACRKAIDVDPHLATAQCNLGIALSDMGLFEEADQALHEALRLNPKYATAHSRLLFNSHYQPSVNPDSLLQAHQEYDRLHTAHLTTATQRKPHDRSRVPLKVGFVSDGFGRHPIGYFLIGLLENLNPRHFQITCYSDRPQEDDFTHRIRQSVHSWRPISAITNNRLLEMICDDKIEILFDLNGHVGGQRLTVFAQQAAPVQITWMGYVGTTGLSSMNFILADSYHIPESHERFYSENVLRLPNDYISYSPPDYAPAVGSLPAIRKGHVTFGCFNQPAKLNAEVVRRWGLIMQEVPSSRLVLHYRGFDDPVVQRRIIEWFQVAQIAEHRISFHSKLPHRQLLEAYNEIDIALDTLPYSGGLTTCEALWMGVPVVTLPGNTFASRHSLSHIHNAGLGESWISGDQQDYVIKATRLATNLVELAEIRKILRERLSRSPVCDHASFALHWSHLTRNLPT